MPKNPHNFDNLMHSFMDLAKDETDKKMEMGTKVKMVDNLVDLFIEGNALRAMKMNRERIESTRTENFPPVRHFTDLFDEDILNIPSNKLNQKDYDFSIGSGEREEGLLPRPKQNPLLGLLNPTNNDEKEKDQFSLPSVEMKVIVEDIISNPEQFKDDLLQLPQSSQNDIFEVILDMSVSNVDIVKKLAPITEQRNPLLRILSPNNKDSRDKNNLSPPSRRQDPLLKQLTTNPRIYSEDFLELPQDKQDQIIKIMENENPNFSAESIVNENDNRNPLKRLLKPNKKDDFDKKHFLPPSYRQNPLLRQLKSNPEQYNEDFLQLPSKDQENVIEILEEEGIKQSSIGKIAKGRTNPLSKMLTPNFRDTNDKKNLALPKYRQDPLLRQLKSHLEEYKDDILELPTRQQDTLLKVLKKEGVPESKIRNILPPNKRQNPLTRLLEPNFKDGLERNNLKLPKYKQDPLLRQLINKPEDYSEDFLSLPLSEQDEIVNVIDKTKTKFFDSNKLVPTKLERNPLMRLLKPNNDNDKKERDQLSPPKLKQNPLLRQLAASPMSFQDDVLELPKEMKISLLQILKDVGARRNVLEQLEKLSIDEFPSLKELFAIESKTQLKEKILKAVTEKPQNYARMFSNLFHHNDLFDFQHTKEEIKDMIAKDPEAVATAFAELIHNQQDNSALLETSTPKLDLPLTSLFTSVSPSSTESSRIKGTSKAKVKVLTQIIKKPKPGSKVKNADFSRDKIEKLQNSIKPKDGESGTSKVVYKTKDGKIIPKEKIKLKENATDEIIFPDKKLKLVSKKKDDKIFTPAVPHPYEDPPKEVEGQLLRLWNEEEKSRHETKRYDSPYNNNNYAITDTK